MAMDQATLDLAARELPMLMTPGYRPPPSYVTGLSWLPGLPPFNMATVDAMRRDYQVKLAMAMKVVPVMKPLFAITGDPEVVDFVKSELRSIWTSSITDMTEAMWYTRFGCEMVYKKADGDVWRFARMMPYHPRDFKILAKDGEITGLRVVSSSSTSDVDIENFAGQPGRSTLNNPILFAPKSFVYVHDKKFGSFEGMSELEGAYPSWVEKVREGGAVASRSLWSYKCMFDSGMIIHPEGSYTDPTTGQQTPYRDFALKIGEAIRNGSVVAVPGVTDGNGNRLWDWVRPEINSGGDALMKLIDHLDGKINKGSGIPDDVIEQVSGTGSYAGRTIPFIAFLEAGTPTVRNISRELCRQTLIPLAQINFGESRGKDWEITEAGVNTAQFLGGTSTSASSSRKSGEGDGDGIPNKQRSSKPTQMSLAQIKETADLHGLEGADRQRFVQYAMGQAYAKSSVTFEEAEPRQVLRAKSIQMSQGKHWEDQPRDDHGQWAREGGHGAEKPGSAPLPSSSKPTPDPAAPATPAPNQTTEPTTPKPEQTAEQKAEQEAWTAAREKVYNKLVAFINHSSIPDVLKEKYTQTTSNVLNNMPTHALKVLHNNVVEAIFYESIPDLGKSVPHAEGKVPHGACFRIDRKQQYVILHLDGQITELIPAALNEHQIYAHEFTHALDWIVKPQFLPLNHHTIPRISSTDDWVDAWFTEIVPNNLSWQAKEDWVEGFAEFGRFLYDQDTNVEQLALKFPLSYAIFKKHGLIKL
ncbi:MAG: hypothetical protein V4719_22935 [Planctomycetota bacterium]